MTIATLEPERIGEAARVLASAFVTNPVNVGAFGAAQLERNVVFFDRVLRAMKGPKFVSLVDGRIVGAIHWVDSPACQFSSIERLRMTPGLVRGIGIRSTRRLISWTSTWARRDPREAHLHLGPIGVAPEFQGRHLGHELMGRYCEALDRSGALGYLETDRPENVSFYQRFGFVVSGQADVLGVPNYFMTARLARSGRES